MSETPERVSCRDAVELLPWLWNGSLDGGEERLVREHLAVCEECRREAGETARAWDVMTRHVPSLALAQYAHGLPPEGIGRGLVERHLASCPSCRQELEWAMADRVADFAAARRAKAAAPRPGRLKVARALGWRGAAVAAGLAALALSAGWFRGFGDREAAVPRELARVEAPAAGPPAAPAWQAGSPDIFRDGFESGGTLEWSQHGNEDEDSEDLSPLENGQHG